MYGSVCRIVRRRKTTTRFPTTWKLLTTSSNCSTMSSSLTIPLDDSSQASRGSALSGSLLARIQASRETSAQSEEPLLVPNYSQVATQETIPAGSSSWNISWPRFTNGGSDSNREATVSLLQVDDDHLEGGGSDDPQHYSMMNYFQTFVQDVYNLFRSMHPVAQVVSVIVLLIVAFKLL